MSALEQEIIERINRLTMDKQEQVLAFVRNLDTSQFSFQDWLARVEQFQTDLRAKYGDKAEIDVQALLDEVREEPLDDRLDRG